MSYANWQSKKGQKCLKEIEEKYEKDIKHEEDFFGTVFLFQTFKSDEEQYQTLQALCISQADLPLFVNNKHEAVRLVVNMRLKHNI